MDVPYGQGPPVDLEDWLANNGRARWAFCKICDAGKAS
jgi:hypothetical protein